MKTDPHTIQIIETAHRLIGNLNRMVEYFWKEDEHWKVCAGLVKWDAQHFQTHLEQHLELVLGLKEESE